MIFATLRLISVLFFRSIGRLFFYLLKSRRKITIDNIKKCYDFIYKREHKNYKKFSPKKIAKKSFSSLGHNFSDFLLLRFYTKKNINRYVNVEGLDKIKRTLEKGKGVILSTAHFGSWELAAHYFALHGLKSLIVYNDFFKRPYWLDGLVKKQREHNGNRLIFKKNSFLALYKHLKKGGIVVLLTDQHALPPEGEKSKIFGQTAWVHTSFIKLGIKTESIILPAFINIDGYFKYNVKIFDPIDTTKNNSVDLISRECCSALEDVVSSNPHQWMWQHRRFKEVTAQKLRQLALKP